MNDDMEVSAPAVKCAANYFMLHCHEGEDGRICGENEEEEEDQRLALALLFRLERCCDRIHSLIVLHLHMSDDFACQ